MSQPNRELVKQNEDQKSILENIDLSTMIDIFSAYGLSLTNIQKETCLIYLEQLYLNKRTFPYLIEVIMSNRYPNTVMSLACKIGMYIPPIHRTGLGAYQFYLKNVSYYESVFIRHNQSVPKLYEIYLSKNRVKLLMKFRDDEILRAGYQFDRNYSDRKEMIKTFIQQNVEIYGEFRLTSNSRRSYTNKAKSILYLQPGEKTVYGANDLLKLSDYQNGIIWKDSSGTCPFNRLSLHLLRQQILEKFEQWKHRDGYLQFHAPVDLGKILTSLENLLANDQRADPGAYLGNPQIEVAF